MNEPRQNPERKRRAGRLERYAIVMALVFLAGCIGPVESNAGKSNGSNSSSKSKGAARPSPVADDPAGTSPVDRLTVQSETVTAQDLWKGFKGDLAAKSEALPTDELRSYILQRTAQLITDRIAEMLLYQKAVLRHAEEVEKRIDAYVDGEIRKTVTADHDGMQRRYEKHLESQGSSLEYARTQLRRQFVIAGYLENEVRPKVAEPTRADLLRAFETNRDNWRKPARRRLSLIDIRTAELLPNDVTEPTREQQHAAREEARARAAAAMHELRGGAVFADVARKYSHGNRAAEGGVWGWVSPDSVRERFRPALAALDQLAAGRFSEPLETPDGFFIVRCDELEPAVEPDFVTMQPQIKEWGFRNVYNRLVAELVTDLRGKARIEPANLDRFHAAVVQAAFDVIKKPSP